jgi:hypothetical protein
LHLLEELKKKNIDPKAEKRIPPNLGSQFATLEANVPSFINTQTSMF